MAASVLFPVTTFLQACRDCSATAPTAVVGAVADDLEQRWCDPSRGYHNLQHLAEVLDVLARLAAAGASQADAPQLVLAAWYHDAVYTGSAGDDEHASAELARSQLDGIGCAAADVERVVQGVLMTAEHRPPLEDQGLCALSDADLAILAAPPARYAEYVAGVRRDYAHIDDETFRQGRAAVLTALLAAAPLFRTAPGQRMYDDAARRNLTEELNSCGFPISPQPVDGA